MTNQKKLRNLLQELFQLDQADLDFGIWKVRLTEEESQRLMFVVEDV